MKPAHVIIILVHALAVAIILAIKTPDIIAWIEKEETVMVVVYRSIEECVGADASDSRRHLCASAEAAARNDEVRLAPRGGDGRPASERIGWAMAAKGAKAFRPVPVYPAAAPGKLELPGGVLIDANAPTVELPRAIVIDPEPARARPEA